MLFEQFAEFGFRRDHVGFSNVPIWFEIGQVVQDARRNLARDTLGIFLQFMFPTKQNVKRFLRVMFAAGAGNTRAASDL